MQIIIKRGTNASSFALSNGRAVVLQPEPVMNEVADEDFGMLLKEYGSFIRPRVHNDKNPEGCFIISDKALYAFDQATEAGKLKDGSAPVSEEELSPAPEAEAPIEVVAEEIEQTAAPEAEATGKSGKQTAKKGSPKKSKTPNAEEKQKE